MYDGICRPGRLDSVSLNIHIKLYLWLYDNTMYLHNKCAQKVAVCADKDVWYQCCRLIVLACCIHSSRGCYEWRGSLCQGPHSITPLPHPRCYIATFALAGTSTSRCIDIPWTLDTFHTVTFNFLLLLHFWCEYFSWISTFYFPSMFDNDCNLGYVARKCNFWGHFLVHVVKIFSVTSKVYNKLRYQTDNCSGDEKLCCNVSFSP